MTITTIWITRTYSDAPELVLAWSEWDIEANYEGWLEDRKKALDALGNDLAEVREIDVVVDYDKIEDAFAAPTVQGETRRVES